MGSSSCIPRLVVLESAGVTESLLASALKRLVGILVEEKTFSWFTRVPLDISSLFTYHICWVFIPWKAESAPLAPWVYHFVWGWSVCCLPAGPWACLPFCIWSRIPVPGSEWTHDRCWVNCRPKTWISLAEMFLVVLPLGVLFLEFSSQADGWEAFSKPFHGFLYQETNLN